MYDTLLQETAEKDIEVIYHPLKGKLMGPYSDNVITITSNLSTSSEKVCILPKS